MKIRALILVAACLALAGCATRTVEEVAVIRFSRCPVDGVKAAIGKSASNRGYRERAPDIYQRTVIRERDPILGLVPISEKPQVALECRFIYESSATGTKIEGIPYAMSKRPFSDKYRETLLALNSSDRSEIVALIDTAIAEASFAAKTNGN